MRSSALLFALAACSAAPTSGTTSLFDLTVLDAPVAGDTTDFYALPYPNALRLDDDGTPALARYVRNGAFLGGYVDTIDASGHGFGPTQAAYFRFTGALDPSTLPTPASSTMPTSSVLFVDVTMGSPHYGERIPVTTRFTAEAGDYIGDDWLAVRPEPGLPPLAGETYAVIVTDGVKATSGTMTAPASLARVLAGTPSGDAETKAAAAYAPLAAWLALNPRNVVAATVYTTSRATSYIDALRTAVLATPAPTLSALAYAKSSDRYDLFTGAYDSPSFQEGDAPYTTTGGAIHLGSDGKPAVVHTDSLRVAIAIPKATMPAAGWPVVVYAPGTGGSYMDLDTDGTADRLAAVDDASGTVLTRFAVVSIDPVLSGPRAPAGTDVETAFFNVQNIVAARDNIEQGALDNFQLVRLLDTIDVAAAPTTNAPILFDPARRYYFGHSEGSLTGTPFFGAEPTIKAGVFSGSGAGLVGSLLEKTQPIDIASLVQAFFSRPVDDLEPLLNLLQGFLDESDPVNHTRRFFDAPPAGNAPKSLFVSLGVGDSYAPDPTILAFALSSGVAAVSPELVPFDDLALTGRSFVSAPQAGNVANGMATGVLCEYAPPPGDDGHFVIYDVEAAIDQSTRFLASHAATGTATLGLP